ncbi:MAG: cytochrome c [Terracidiphilus sp.]|jgi:mono/diheme cytochrome c family protein
MTSRIGTAALILLSASLAGPAFSQARGADIYKAKCAVCHGADGLAVTPMARIVKTLSFKDPAILKATDAQLFDSTKNGKFTMKGYGGMLTDAQIKDLVFYMRTLQK